MDFFSFLIWGFFSLFFCLWFKSVAIRLWWFFFVFLIWGFFFHFIAFGLSPSGLGYDGFLLFLSWGFFFILCPWFNSVGFRLWWGFFVFWFGACFFHFIASGLSPSGLGYDGFFKFSDLGLLLPFYCLWFKSVGFTLWWIFFVFWFGASSSILLPLL